MASICLKCFSFFSSALDRVVALFFRTGPIWKDARGFAGWFEDNCESMAEDADQQHIEIQIDGDCKAKVLKLPGKDGLDDFSRLWGFFASLGISKVVLDSRLESNQIEDVVVYLFKKRRYVRDRFAGTVGKLFAEPGVHIACTDTIIQGRTLTVNYSYCTLKFSRIVRWLEKTHKKLGDHRTLFKYAPRITAMIVAVSAVPTLIYAYRHDSWIVAIPLVAEALVLGGLTYLFFMVIGSVEYDNEEKAWQLKKAYKALKRYSDQTQADIKRARSVQQRFLPKADSMPIPDKLRWAFSFAPAVEVGGDYFDARVTSDGNVAILFSDVCGHGMAAAFITAILKTTFIAWVQSGEGIGMLAEKLNSALFSLTPEDSFAALFLAIYHPADGKLLYVNFGHQPEPWLLPGDIDRAVTPLCNARNLIMGVQADNELEVAELQLDQGDMVLFVSDGLVEAQNTDGEYYTTERFEEFIGEQRKCGINELIDNVNTEVNGFAQGTVQADDMTVLALEVK